ncbi:CRAL-TRIO domain-containing protein [Lipomyces arxii]|uniref:CRAL-TRIO domain-containing protein n=1 Tax=Lipomyces arxii TaxID=56418 RepID=UPI0034CE9475
MVRYVPFAEPLPSCKPPKRPPLTTQEQEKYDQLLAYVKAIEELPVSLDSKEKKMMPLDDEEKAWVTKECLLRYLRATKWKLADAEKRVEGTLVWRREYGVKKLTPEYIGIENETGKQVILGYDFDARPCLYMFPARQNTEKSDRQIQHLVFSLERVIDFLPSGQENLALLIDFKSSTSSKNPSVAQGRQVLHILQTHYPERLGKALVINIPWFVWTFLKIIHPFIDPLTREKLVFSEPIDKYVPAEHLDPIFGGKSEFEYHHEKYWNAMCQMANEKHERYMARWRKLGGGIGLSEAVLRANSDLELQEEQNKYDAMEAEAEGSAIPVETSAVRIPDELAGIDISAEEAAAQLDGGAGVLGEKKNSLNEQMEKVSIAEKSS